MAVPVLYEYIHFPFYCLGSTGAGDEKVALELPPLRRNCLNFFTEKFIGPANTAKFCPYSHHDYQEDRRRTRSNPTFGGILLEVTCAPNEENNGKSLLGK